MRGQGKLADALEKWCCVSAPKSKLGLPEAQELAAVFAALADSTRVQIVSVLFSAGKGGVCVCDIGANFPLGQPTISHHLKVLKDAGLVSAEKKGLWVFYSVNRERLAQIGITLSVPQRRAGPSGCEDEGCTSHTTRERSPHEASSAT